MKLFKHETLQTREACLPHAGQNKAGRRKLFKHETLNFKLET
jgi:hypothetical protein